MAIGTQQTEQMGDEAQTALYYKQPGPNGPTNLGLFMVRWRCILRFTLSLRRLLQCKPFSKRALITTNADVVFRQYLLLAAGKEM